MTMRSASPFAAALVLILGACAGAGAGSDSGRAANSQMRVNLGTSSRAHIVSTATEALLSRYGYRFDRDVNTGEEVRLETSWRDVPTAADEQAAGVSFVRTRISVIARPRSRAGGNANTFSTRMIAEVIGRATAASEWVEIPMTAERRAYFDEIADYLENEFKGGVR